MPERRVRTTPDAIVVGGGIAGLTAALRAAHAGLSVTVVTKDVLGNASTRFAQGGIAAVLFDDDRIEDHIADTLRAGAGLADPEAVRVLVEDGPARIRDLIDHGVVFDHTPDGDLVKGLEAAHSYPRILHAGGDATGWAIEQALVAAVREAGLTVIEHAFLLDLVQTPVRSDARERRVTGVELLVDGERRTLGASAVVLATGGAGQLYQRTTNPAIATGDGVAVAARAGAVIRDLEFVQFHPTVLALGEPFLISEAVRGEGAVLRDESGARYAFDAHPDGELAPRDVVARATAQAMRAQGGRPALLDATGIHSTDATARAAFLADRFPTIDQVLRERGIDWARELVPVTPAAHYMMGGIDTDLDGRTSLAGLYAVGEVARTGVHGANRLASNSLLEGAVFGARCADALIHDAATPARSSSALRLAARFLSEERSDESKGAQGPEIALRSVSGERSDESKHPALRLAALAQGPEFSRAALQDLMWEHAGLVRNEGGLRHAASVLAGWRAERAPGAGEPSPADAEDDNLLLAATLLVDAARARSGSVGAHFRDDDTEQTHTDRTPALASASHIREELAPC